MLADKKERKHSTWVKQYIKDRRRYGALCFQSRYMQYFRMDGVIMDAIYNNFVCQIKLFRGVFSLNYVTISTNNKTRNKTSASTGSLAGSKRVSSTFHLSSTRTNQRTCCINLDMSRLMRRESRSMQQVRDPVFDKNSRKRVANPHELVENLAANLVENQVCSQVCSLLE